MTAADARPLKHGELPSPHDAMARLLARLAPVTIERVPLDAAAGRVLAEPVVSDRPSPPCDVSAMDGYAVRLADAARGRLPVAGEAAIGQAPAPLPEGAAMRIFTGAATPPEAEAVIRREDVREAADAIEFDPAMQLCHGQNIRWRGENGPAGSMIAEPGTPLMPAVVAALAAFGVANAPVYRRVRVAALVTGDELLPIDARPQPWHIRDSNGAALAALLGAAPWIELHRLPPVADVRPSLEHALAGALAESDAVILTGGVSMGVYDFVPDVVRAVGGEVMFHKVALRPGKPMLGAVGPAGQAILGLPGNPVSVIVTARRWASAALRRRAGFSQAIPPAGVVTLTNADARRLRLWWYRPVRLVGDGQAELVATMGSGDLVSTAGTDGFVELPPDADGPGPWPFYPWSMT